MQNKNRWAQQPRPFVASFPTYPPPFPFLPGGPNMGSSMGPDMGPNIGYQTGAYPGQHGVEELTDGFAGERGCSMPPSSNPDMYGRVVSYCSLQV